MVTRKMPPRRQRIWAFLQEFYLDNGIPPTVRDIQKACEISSTSVVDYNLEKLKEAGSQIHSRKLRSFDEPPFR